MTKLLVLGGTVFLGRHVVTAALARGWTVTTFSRGVSNPAEVAGVEALHGDRDGDLSALAGRRFDVVVDTSAYRAQHVERVATLLSAVVRYLLVSSVSVYADFGAGDNDEESATWPPLTAADAPLGAATYGPLKVACEREAERQFGERATIVRPGLLFGPLDATNRFGYWLERISEGGETLAPGDEGRTIQLLDARDLADWMVSLVAEDRAGTFNAAGPHDPLTFGALLRCCVNASGSGARLTWVPDDFLLGAGVAPFDHLPLWLPAGAGGVLQVNIARAIEAGLRYRPLASTVADAYAAGPISDRPLAGGVPKPQPMSRARERELLALWHAASCMEVR